MAKSKPIGVRFDLEKLELIQKEQNLISAQSVLNYLMDSYGKRSPNLEDKQETIQVSAKMYKTSPIGLKGIDLAIWKAQNPE